MERVGWLPRMFAAVGFLVAAVVFANLRGGRDRGAAACGLPAATRGLMVHNSRQLERALAHSRRTNIVLAPGIYRHRGPFHVRDGKRLYAARLGAAVLKAGIVLGAPGGRAFPVLRGLLIDVRDRSETLDGDAIHVWGPASRARILDTTVLGHRRIDGGIIVRQPEGFVARRVVVRGFRSYGVLVDPDEPGYNARRPFQLDDVAVSHVAWPVRGVSGGRAEACFWLGSRGATRRVSAFDCGLAGIWTGSANSSSLVHEAEIDRTPVGIYLEHFTTDGVFEARVGPSVQRGVNAEWADPVWGGRPASVGNVFRDSTFRTSLVGVFLDEGTSLDESVRLYFRRPELGWDRQLSEASTTASRATTSAGCCRVRCPSRWRTSDGPSNRSRPAACAPRRRARSRGAPGSGGTSSRPA